MDQYIAAEIAKKYIGQKEIPDNQGFINEDFEKLISACGWKKGQAWCAYFAELVWKEAFPDLFPVLDKLFNAGAVNTWSNFSQSDQFICDRVPESGAIAIWQTYKNYAPYWTGHAGIVDYMFEDKFMTIEGNTNSQGGREGIEVASKIRTFDFNAKLNGLVLKGFIKIK
jgi:hypothetical protein